MAADSVHPERRARARGTDVIESAAVLSHVPDEVLARQAGLGDKPAFAQIITRHGPGLYRYVHRLLRDHGEAEDCVQNVLIAAWRGVGSFRGESTVRTWLLVMGRHEALKLLQRKHPHFPQSGSRPVIDFVSLSEMSDHGGDAATANRDADVLDEHADPARDAIDSSLLAALDDVLRALPERQSSAWMLREVEDMSYAEIAAALGTTPIVVRGLLQRARAAVAVALEEWR